MLALLTLPPQEQPTKVFIRLHCGSQQGGSVSSWFPSPGLSVALMWALSLLRWFSSFPAGFHRD